MNFIDKIKNYSLAIMSLIVLLGFLVLVIAQLRGDAQIQTIYPLGPISLHLYGLIILAAILISTFVFTKIKPDDLLNINTFNALFWVVLPSLIFARIWHVVTDYELYSNNFWGIFRIDQGGLSVWGAAIGGIMAFWIYTKIHGFGFRLSLNYAAVVFPLGQAIGRFANFFNQELFGAPTNVSWGMYVAKAHRPERYINSEFFHPTPIYESVLTFAAFFSMIYILIYLKKAAPQLLKESYILVAIYGVFYAIIRFVVEFYRLDSRMEGFLTLNQFISLGLLLISGSYIVYHSMNFVRRKYHGKN